MKPTDDPFDDALRERFAVGGPAEGGPAGFGADPDPLAFDRIRAELTRTGVDSVPVRRTRWGRTAVGLLALLLVGTGLGERLFIPAGKRTGGVLPVHREYRPVATRLPVAGFQTNPKAPAIQAMVPSVPAWQVGASVGVPGGALPEDRRFPARNGSFLNPRKNDRSANQRLDSKSSYFFEDRKLFSENHASPGPENQPGFALKPLQSRTWAAPRWGLPPVVGQPVPALSRRFGAGRLAWFGTVAGQYAYANLMPNSSDDGFVRHVQSAGRFAPGRLGWRAQVGFEKPLSESWSLRLSLVFNQLNQKFSYTEQTGLLDSVATSRPDPTSVTVQSFYQTRSGQTEFRQQFAGLNAAVLRRFGKTFYALAGGEAGLAWGTTGQQPTGALTAGLGASHPVGGGWSLRVEPTLRFSTTAYQTTDGRFGWRPYTVGLAVGLQKQ